MINKRRTKSGMRYDVRLRRPTGTTYNKTFTTKREAERHERAELTARDRGSWIDPRNSSRTLADVAHEWLASSPAKRASSFARDEIALRKHILPALGARSVGSLTPRDIQGEVNRWCSTMAPRSTRRTYGVLRAVLNMAVNSELVTRTPCRGIKLPAVTQSARVLPSPEDVARLAQAVGDEHGLMVWLGAMLGLRWGEVAGLRVSRLDLLRGRLLVAEQITRGAGGRRVLGEPKSQAGRRTLTVPPSLIKPLSAHLARRGLTATDATAFVFVSPEGQPLDYSVWRRRVWQPACRRVGLDGLGFHDLRRLNATVLVEEGVNVKTAQARLGHSDPRLTLAIYAQATDAADQAAADLIGIRFSPPPQAV